MARKSSFGKCDLAKLREYPSSSKHSIAELQVIFYEHYVRG